MKRPRIRMQAAALTFILLPAAAGVVAVHASATCERFVRTYVTKPVRSRVSRETADAWAKWRIAHPNWKPNPAVHRPKYVMTRDEAVHKMEFACSVPIIPATLDMLFTEADFDVPPPIVILPPTDTSQIAFPDELPPEVAELTPDNSWPPLAPFVPIALGSPPAIPQLPAVPPPIPPYGGAVSEPGSLLLVTTGLGCICLLLAAKIRARNETQT